MCRWVGNERKERMKKKKDPFAVTNEEFAELEAHFSDLCYFVSWQLMRKNLKNNHTEDVEDVTQRIRMAVIRAGRYYKRQVYIETGLKLIEEYANDRFTSKIVEELKFLWSNRTKHGANRQRFGEHQEQLLDMMIEKCVPKECRPKKNATLLMDKKFTSYCKAIAWNEQKSLGKRISRERSIRSSMCSLSEFDYLAEEHI